MAIRRTHLLVGFSAFVILCAVIVYHFMAERDETISSLAVLPLQNLSGNPDDEFYADGMTEALITELSKIKALRVISRISIMHYKKSTMPVSSIALELNVDAIVKGSMRFVGERIHIAVEMIEAAGDQRIWAAEYEKNIDDILTIQEDVARDITAEIKVAVTPEEEARLAAAGPVVPTAHEAYLKGRFLINTWTKTSIEEGIEHFERAIELDPRNALAYAGLAKSYDILASFDWISPGTGWPKARTAAIKALEIDETLAEAHVVLADVKFMYDWDWNAAERGFRRAIELSPGSSEARIFHSGYLMSTGQMEAAYNEMLFAAEHDPHSFGIKRLQLILYIYSRQLELARTKARELLADDPENFEAHYLLGWVYKEEEKYDLALEQYRNALMLHDLSPTDSLRALAGIARTHALSGETEKARALLGNLVEKSRNALITPYIVAKVFSLLGETDLAFEWLEKAYVDRSPYLSTILVDPELDAIRTDQRYDTLLRKMGLGAGGN